MLFYEPLFLFGFAPAVVTIYALLGSRQTLRIALLLLFSIAFYVWGEPRFVPIVIASALLDHVVAKRIAASAGRPWRQLLLAFGIGANVAILVYYKYLNFLVTNFAELVRAPGLAIPSIVLPIGVSFIVFEKITYLVDVARRQSAPAPNIWQYLAYVFFFPKLLAGPIIKYHEIDGQFRRTHHMQLGEAASGMLRFMLGVVKKTLIADTVSRPADEIFRYPSDQLGFTGAWLGVLLFTLQIYFDFSAYSDMAIGIARILGFRLRENFNMPYVSGSITEFWRRWHISLATWIRDYLYIPLGGSRRGPARTYLNLWLCFLASGLWHGAAWTYVVWGAYNGLFLVLDRLFLLRLLDRLPRPVATLLTMIVVMIGWTIFRATSLAQAGDFFAAMADPARTGTLPFLPWDAVVLATSGAVLCAAPSIPRLMPAIEAALHAAIPRFVVDMVLASLFAVAISIATADPFKPFLYFRF